MSDTEPERMNDPNREAVGQPPIGNDEGTEAPPAPTPQPVPPPPPPDDDDDDK